MQINFKKFDFFRHKWDTKNDTDQHQNWYGGIPKMVLNSTKIGMGGYQKWCWGIPKMVLNSTKIG